MLVRQVSRAVFQVEAGKAEQLCRGGDLASHGLRRADVERPLLDLAIELLTRHRTAPTALGADAIAHRFVIRKELVASLTVASRDVSRGVQADGQLRLAELGKRTAIELDERQKPLRRTADDREHQR